MTKKNLLRRPPLTYEGWSDGENLKIYLVLDKLSFRDGRCATPPQPYTIYEYTNRWNKAIC